MKLHDYITARMEQPFIWGTHDCILFTVGWAEIAADKKYLPDVIWRNEEEAMQMLKEVGGIASVFEKYFTSIKPNFARDGDLAVIGTRSYIFSGSHIVGVGESGLFFRNRLEAKRAFHV